MGERTMTQSVLGIVGGSGFYNLPGLAHAEWRRIESPWGAPSDDILFADIDGLQNYKYLKTANKVFLVTPATRTVADVITN